MKIKNSIVYILGLFFYPLGICLTLKSNLGVSPWDGISNLIMKHNNLVSPNKINLGDAVIIVGITIICIGGILDYKNKLNKLKLINSTLKRHIVIIFEAFGAIIITLIIGFIINFWIEKVNYLPSSQGNIVLSFVYLILGIIILGTGIACYVFANEKLIGAIDYFTLSIASLTKKQFGTVKIIVEFGMLLIITIYSLLLNNYVDTQLINIGSLISVFSLGTIINIVSGPIKKMLED